MKTYRWNFQGLLISPSAVNPEILVNKPLSVVEKLRLHGTGWHMTVMIQRLYGTRLSSLDRLLRAQNSLTSCQSAMPVQSSISLSMRWLSVTQRILYKPVLLAFRVRLSATPLDLVKESLYILVLVYKTHWPGRHVRTSSRSVRSANAALLSVPRTPTVVATRTLSVIDWLIHWLTDSSFAASRFANRFYLRFVRSRLTYKVACVK